MATPDPTAVFLVGELLKALDPEPDETPRSYVDNLRRLQGVLITLMANSELQPEGDQDATVMDALGRLDPHREDARLPFGERVRRVQAWVDIELSRWTSAIVQPRGPSGACAVPEAQPVPVE